MEAQRQAFDFLIDHKAEVLDTVLHSVLGTYCDAYFINGPLRS